MKKTIITLVSIAAFAVALTQTARGVPITGIIGFSGTAQLDGQTVGTSTEVLAWHGNNITGVTSGSFAGLTGSPVILAAPWFFNSGLKNNFWTVAGFTFNLTSSSVSSTSAKSITIALAGTVVSSIAGLDPTAFIGNFTVQDPSSINGGVFSYTESMSFGSAAVPDGGNTVLLLGVACIGIFLFKRKLGAAALVS